MKCNFLFCAIFAACVAPVCLAASNPWNGAWKLNEAKSKRTGSVDTITQSSDGRYTVATSGITLSFSCDGAEYPMPGGRMVTCSRVGDTAMHLVFRAGGEELAQVDRTLSDNGKTMTMVETGKPRTERPSTTRKSQKKSRLGLAMRGQVRGRTSRWKQVVTALQS